MTSRQAGHFFFEPKGYDEVNQATHEHKEAIKVGYNLRRKVVLLAIWALSPLAAGARSGAVRHLRRRTRTWPDSSSTFGMIWLVVGLGGLLFRTVHLCFLRDVQTGLVWCTKILTDPFHDIKLYHKAPLHLLRGELSTRCLSEACAAIGRRADRRERASISRRMPRWIGAFVSAGRVPPPAVGSHGRAAGDEARRHLLEIRSE